jgi:hypothetical protein
LEFAAGVVVVKYVIGRIFAIDAGAITAFDHMDSIVFTIVKTVYVTHCFLCDLWLTAMIHAAYGSDSA